jgi:hypothetical protein
VRIDARHVGGADFGNLDAELLELGIDLESAGEEIFALGEELLETLFLRGEVGFVAGRELGQLLLGLALEFGAGGEGLLEL